MGEGDTRLVGDGGEREMATAGALEEGLSKPPAPSRASAASLQVAAKRSGSAAMPSTVPGRRTMAKASVPSELAGERAHAGRLGPTSASRLPRPRMAACRRHRAGRASPHSEGKYSPLGKCSPLNMAVGQLPRLAPRQRTPFPSNQGARRERASPRDLQVRNERFPQPSLFSLY